MGYSKGLPAITPDNEEFWASCKKHQMSLQECSECKKSRYFVSPVCPYCGSLNFTWEPVSGKAAIYSYTIIHRALSEAWKDDSPYVYAYVQLAEGPLLPTNIVGCSPEEVEIGMEVEVTYDDVTPEITLPKFKPIS